MRPCMYSLYYWRSNARVFKLTKKSKLIRARVYMCIFNVSLNKLPTFIPKKVSTKIKGRDD